MSETTSTLLASIFVALISLLPFRKLAEENTTNKRPPTGATGRSTNYSCIRNFFIGLLAVASVLTAPGLIFPIVTISIMLLISNFRRGPDLLALLTGLLIPLLSWEYHCYLAEGKVVPMLLTSLDKNTRIEKEWVLTWARSPEETLLGFNEFAWNADDDFTGVPEHAFRTEKEKLSIVESYRKQAGAKNTEETERTANERRHLISEITLQRRRNDALQCYILLPIVRGTLSWINQQPIGFQNHESLSISARLLPWNFLAEIRQYGLFRATLRSLRGTIGIFAIVTHWGSIAMIIYCFFRSYRISHLHTLILAASLLAFTYMHGLAGPECRRNLPFLPIFFGLPAIVTALALQRRETSEFVNI